MTNFYIAKLDYLSYSTNMIDKNIEADLRTTPAQPIADRFYKYEYDTPNYIVRTGKKNRNLRSASVRVKHDMLPFILDTGSPKDYNLTRLDVCVDCKTKEEAMAYTTLQYYSQVHSYSNGDFGETWYFGDRTQPLFERVYWKIEHQVWRYELEIKPQNRPLPIKKWLEINPEVRQVYSDVNRSFVNKVKEFMTACGQMVNVVPTIPDEGTRQMRHSILIEEVNELQSATTHIDALDAITDILYVLLGTAHAYGLGDKVEAAFNEVHRSNMTKVMPDGKVLKREDGKIIKPDTYEKPNLQKVLELQENTVEWWLNQITDPIIKRLALGNMVKEDKDSKERNYFNGLAAAFDWGRTKEGGSFWVKVSNDPNITFESVKHLLPENYVL